MFYLFDQNNSGGRFAFIPQSGISARVYIEAATAREADERAQRIGIYFDGVEEGFDCSCCGDRWYRQWGDGMAEAPTEYQGFMKWIKHGPEAYVHPLEGDFYPIPFKKIELR